MPSRLPRLLLLCGALCVPIALACAGGTRSAEEAPPPPPPADWSTLFPTRAAFPAVTRGVAPGMTRAQALQADPTFTDGQGWTAPGFPELRFRAELDPVTDTVRALVVELPTADAEAKLSAAWGPPALVKRRSDAGTGAVWWDAAAGRRAVLGPPSGPTRALSVSTYLPADRLVGTGSDWAFLDAGPVFGKTPDELALAYGDRLRVADRTLGVEAVYGRLPAPRPAPGPDRELWLSLPPTEYAAASTRARLGFSKDGRCSSFRLALDYAGVVPARDAIAAAVAAKFGGSPSIVEEGDRTLTLYSSKPRVTGEVDEVAEQYLVKVELGGPVDHRPRAGARRPRPGQGAARTGRPAAGALKPANR